MVRLFILLSLFSSFALVGCGSVSGLNLGQYPDPTAAPDNFIHCHGYGCGQKTRIGFNEFEWKSIRTIFSNPAHDAQMERQKIAKAVALMEQYAGKLVGVENDLPKAPIIRQSHKELDCIDETINTTKYLIFLEKDNLLLFHQVDRPVYKGMLLNGVYPHNSATIKEKNTGKIYVVDSYIFKNGDQPNIRPLDSWKKYNFDELDKIHNQTAVDIENFKP